MQRPTDPKKQLTELIAEAKAIQKNRDRLRDGIQSELLAEKVKEILKLREENATQLAEKINEIMNLLKTNPLLVMEKFGRENKSVLHLAVMDHLPELVNALLEKYRHLIASKDNKGLTPLHCAVHLTKDDLRPLIVDRLIDNMTAEQINAQDEERKTALHYAMEITSNLAKRSETIIKIVVRSGECLHIKDKVGLTPLDIAKQSKNLALIIEELTPENRIIERIFPNNHTRFDDTKSIGTLVEEFKSLDLCDRGDKLRLSIEGFFRSTPISSSPQRRPTNDSPARRKLSSHMIEVPITRSHSDQQKNGLWQLEEQFETHLYKAGLNDTDLTVSEIHIFEPESVNNTLANLCAKYDLENPTIPTLLLLSTCAGYRLDNPNNNLGFRKIYVAQILQALLSKITPTDILSILNRANNKFTRTERLIAYFIIKEIFISANHFNINNEKFNRELRDFFSKYRSTAEFELKTILNNILKVRNVHIKNPNEELDDLQVPTNAGSFKSLVENYLNANSQSEKKYCLKKIATELRLLNAAILSRIPLTELYNGNWTKDEGKNTPWLSLHNHLMRQMTPFIQEIIFTASNPSKVFKDFISLAHYLIQNNHFLGPDIASARVILSSLDDGPFTRLEGYIVLSELQEKFAHLKRLLLPSYPKDFIRLHLFSGFSTFIPSIPLIIRDLTMLGENPAYIKNHYFQLGKIYSDILRLQRTYRLAPLPETDVLNFFKNTPFPSADDIYKLSYRIEPLKVSFDSHEFKIIYDQLMFNANNGHLAHVFYEGKLHEPKDSIYELLKYLHNLLYTPGSKMPRPENQFIKDGPETLLIKDAAETLLRRLIPLANQKFPSTPVKLAWLPNMDIYTLYFQIVPPVIEIDINNLNFNAISRKIHDQVDNYILPAIQAGDIKYNPREAFDFYCNLIKTKENEMSWEDKRAANFLIGKWVGRANEILSEKEKISLPKFFNSDSPEGSYNRVTPN